MQAACAPGSAAGTQRRAVVFLSNMQLMSVRSEGVYVVL